jgi:hypothetical protein
MIESTAITINHLFDSVHCRLLDKSDTRYREADVLAVWSIHDDFAVKLKTDGYLHYEDFDAPGYHQILYSVKELYELINYFCEAV